MAKKAASKKKVAKKAAGPKKAMKIAKPVSMIPKVRAASRPRNNNTNSYTFSEFVENVKGFCGLAKRSQAKELIDDLNALVRDSLKKGYKIPLLGLGKMYVRQTKARLGRNPATGETINIPAKRKVRFTPAKALKEAVL